MNIQSWMIKSWATLEWYLPQQTEQLPRFKHVGTQMRDDGSSSGFRAGDTVWMAQEEQWRAGLAWEWLEVKPGVVMLADPNSIITNLQFVDSDQKPVYGLAKTVAINRLVHALAWQHAVCELLHLDERAAPFVGHTSAPRQLEPVNTDGAHRVMSRNEALPVLRRPALTADLHAVPAQGRRSTADQHPRRARSRSTDREEGLQGVALQDLRRAA